MNSTIKSLPENALDNARNLASRSLGAVSESAAAAQKHLGQYTQATTRYVRDQPLKSALIAAAVGAAVAGLIIAARRYRDHH